MAKVKELKKLLLIKKKNKKQKKQKGGFIHRLDFNYAGRDAVNQAEKVTPGVIKRTLVLK